LDGGDKEQLVWLDVSSGAHRLFHGVKSVITGVFAAFGLAGGR